MADKNADKRPKDANPRRRRRITQFQDLEPSLRREIVSYLQPTPLQQHGLRVLFEDMAEMTQLRKEAEELSVNRPIIQSTKNHEKAAKTRYQKRLEEVTKTPGIWETYRYFWDETKPFPDQDGGGGGGYPLTT